MVFRVINFTRITEGKRKGNGREIEACRRHLSRTRLGLVTESSSSTESCQNDSLPKPSTKRKWNGRELARHRCLETGGTCSPLWCDIGQAGTSLVIWIYPHNGRKTEGERKGNGREVEARRGHLSRARLGLVTESSSSTDSCQNDSLPKPSAEWKGTEGILARHRSLETGGACSSLWCDIGHAGTSFVILIYPHNGRATEGERKDDKSSSRKSSRRLIFDY